MSTSTFQNITNFYNGGVLYLSAYYGFTLTSCVFEKCSAQYGGAIYINEWSIFSFVRCKFLNNSATYSGNDIYNSQNIIELYSAADFYQTCSSSDIPRVVFGDGTNIDNYLLGVFFFFFFFFDGGGVYFYEQNVLIRYTM
jgi:hypothetical protein